MNLFREFKSNKSNSITPSEIYTLLGKLGLRLDDSNMSALMAAVDKNNAGVINFDEFIAFITNGRYT